MSLNDGARVNERFADLVKEASTRSAGALEDGVPYIYIGMATCGLAAGAEETREAFEQALADRHIEARIVPVGCLGHCYAEPLVVVHAPEYPPLSYFNVSPGRARVLVKAFLEEGDPLQEFLYGATEMNDLFPTVNDFPRFSLEKKVVMEKCGQINPDDIYQYIAAGGYAALAKALVLDPEHLIRQVIEAGLRGRGGAGFPTGKKWQLARQSPEKERYVICNADEGDPGAYMDRTILESNPHQLIEGLVICAYSVGAHEAIVYIRAEYPLAVKVVRNAILQAREAGLVGKGILGSDYDLEVSVFEGSGAFVCGEETALIQSMEGQRGMPRVRPPYPVEKGLWGKPTEVNNVKTLSTVPLIIARGSEWFKGIGTSSSPGTAIFSVVGDVLHPGLVEIPMGTTLRSLIFDVCGGVPDKKAFKAVQIGGPSGGCLPSNFLDTPVDFDSLTLAGAMMGSGGMVVMDEDTCMVDVARYFIDFTQKESCGKCTFCRIGTLHLLNILDRITKGEGKEEDLNTLDILSQEIKEGSLCGLGKTAPNPVLTSLRYFREEYRAHVREKRCPAKVCRALTAYYIDLDRCARGCDACVGCCPVEAIFTTPDRKKGVDQEKCVKCGECMMACPPEYDAVRKVSPPELAPIVERAPERPPAEKR